MCIEDDLQGHTDKNQLDSNTFPQDKQSPASRRTDSSPLHIQWVILEFKASWS